MRSLQSLFNWHRTRGGLNDFCSGARQRASTINSNAVVPCDGFTLSISEKAGKG
jgi:hypothetical protein